MNGLEKEREECKCRRSLRKNVFTIILSPGEGADAWGGLSKGKSGRRR